MSSKTWRIQSSSGRWARHVHHALWVNEEWVTAWSEAQRALGSKAPPELAEAVRLAGELGWHESLATIRLEMTPEAQAEVDRRLEVKRQETLSNGRRHWGSQSPEQIWASNQGYWRERLIDELTPRTKARALRLPLAVWSDKPGEATLYFASEAQSFLSQSSLAEQLRALLPKARAAVKKAGLLTARLTSHEPSKPGVGSLEFFGASISEFRAAEEFLDREAIAVHASRGERGGFLNVKGQLLDDLAEACLFSSEKAAKAFARKHVGDAHAVKVRVSAMSCYPLLGTPSASSNLLATMAEREKRELERLLESAKMEDLLAELERRKSQERSAPVEPAPSAPRSRSRI